MLIKIDDEITDKTTNKLTLIEKHKPAKPDIITKNKDIEFIDPTSKLFLTTNSALQLKIIHLKSEKLDIKTKIRNKLTTITISQTVIKYSNKI